MIYCLIKLVYTRRTLNCQNKLWQSVHVRNAIRLLTLLKCLAESRMAPAWYHSGRRGAYDDPGDRHPEEYINDDPDAFEETTRECGNCGRSKGA